MSSVNPGACGLYADAPKAVRDPEWMPSSASKPCAFCNQRSACWVCGPIAPSSVPGGTPQPGSVSALRGSGHGVGAVPGASGPFPDVLFSIAHSGVPLLRCVS